jgi:circadian clock protein KaiC
MSVIKKRSGFHESTIREFRIANTGLSVGQPLEDFHGVLRGVPTYAGGTGTLMQGKDK